MIGIGTRKQDSDLKVFKRPMRSGGNKPETKKTPLRSDPNCRRRKTECWQPRGATLSVVAKEMIPTVSGLKEKSG